MSPVNENAIKQIEERLAKEIARLDQRSDIMAEQLTGVRLTLASIDTTLKALVRTLGRLDEHMTGTSNEPGLKTKVDRLEQLELGRRWQMRTFWGAVITGAVTLVMKVLNKF